MSLANKRVGVGSSQGITSASIGSDAVRSFRCRMHKVASCWGSIRVNGFFLTIREGDNGPDAGLRDEPFHARMEEKWGRGLNGCQQLLASSRVAPKLSAAVYKLLRCPALMEVWHVFQRISEAPRSMPERLLGHLLRDDYHDTKRGDEIYDIAAAKTELVDEAYLQNVLDSLCYRISEVHKYILEMQTSRWTPAILSLLAAIIDIITLNRDALCHVHRPSGVALKQPFDQFLSRSGINRVLEDAVLYRDRGHPMAKREGGVVNPLSPDPVDRSQSAIPFEKTVRQGKTLSESTVAPSTAPRADRLRVERDHGHPRSQPCPISCSRDSPFALHASSQISHCGLDTGRDDFSSYRDGVKRTMQPSQTQEESEGFLIAENNSQILGVSLDTARFNALLQSNDPSRGSDVPRMFYAPEKAEIRTANAHKWSGFYPAKWKQLHIFPSQLAQWETFRLKCLQIIMDVVNRFDLTEATLHDAWKLTNSVFYESCQGGIRSLDDVIMHIDNNLTVTQSQKVMFGVYTALTMAIKVHTHDGRAYELLKLPEKLRKYFVCDPGANHPLSQHAGSFDSRSVAFDHYRKEWEAVLAPLLDITTPLELLESQIEMCAWPEPALVFTRACFLLARCYLTPVMDMDVSLPRISTAAMYAAVYSLRQEFLIPKEETEASIRAAKLCGWLTYSTSTCSKKCYSVFANKFSKMSSTVANALTQRYASNHVFLR